MLEPEDRRTQAKNVLLSNTGSKSFFSDVDDELSDEWKELGGASDTTLVDGRVVSRDALQGIRVGSAGGWSLEVFPGDFVVHR